MLPSLVSGLISFHPVITTEKVENQPSHQPDILQPYSFTAIHRAGSQRSRVPSSCAQCLLSGNLFNCLAIKGRECAAHPRSGQPESSSRTPLNTKVFLREAICVTVQAAQDNLRGLCYAALISRYLCAL